MDQPVKKFGLRKSPLERWLVRLWSDRLTSISRQGRMFSGCSQSKIESRSGFIYDFARKFYVAFDCIKATCTCFFKKWWLTKMLYIEERARWKLKARKARKVES